MHVRPSVRSSPCNSIIVVRPTDQPADGRTDGRRLRGPRPGPSPAGPASPGPRGAVTPRRPAGVATTRDGNKLPRVLSARRLSVRPSVDKFSCRSNVAAANNYHVTLNVRSCCCCCCCWRWCAASPLRGATCDAERDEFSMRPRRAGFCPISIKRIANFRGRAQCPRSGAAPQAWPLWT